MDYLAKARMVIALEMEELQRLHDRLDESFVQAVHLLQATVEAQRKIIICGVGKSGNICQKIAATLNSTGSPAVVLNSQDALHGDLGLVNEGDVVLLLSYSGETDEIVHLLPHLKRVGASLIAITGGTKSTLARHSNLTLDVNVQREACPLNLAPTSSSTAMLVLGDALAMVLLEARGFASDDFARLHPGGSLGRALLTKVSDVMRSGDRLARIPESALIVDALRAMTAAKSGAVVVVETSGKLAGIFTQGDFVRAFQAHAQVGDLPVAQFMSRRPITIHADQLAGHLLQLLEKHTVDEVIVVNSAGEPLGVVDTQDLSKVKIL
jgi:arabinose-5-phosphate isomerase